MEPEDPFHYRACSPPRPRAFGLGAGVDAAPAGCPAGDAEAQVAGSSSPGDEVGTPKAPRVPFDGRPGRACPGAPRKGRAPPTYFDLSGEGAPVRRLSFGNDDEDGTEGGSFEPSEDLCGPEGMDEDESPANPQLQHPPPQQQHHHHQQWQQHPQPPQHPQQQQHQPHWPEAQQGLQPPQCQQQWPLRAQPQQLWVGQLQSPAPAPVQQQQQQPLWHPLSPTGPPPPPRQPGGTTPARLFR